MICLDMFRTTPASSQVRGRGQGYVVVVLWAIPFLPCQANLGPGLCCQASLHSCSEAFEIVQESVGIMRQRCQLPAKPTDTQPFLPILSCQHAYPLAADAPYGGGALCTRLCHCCSQQAAKVLKQVLLHRVTSAQSARVSMLWQNDVCLCCNLLLLQHSAVLHSI